MARIPQGIIEDIKFRCPIDDVIGSYLRLSRAGTNLKGLCPFHSEKTPSFTVFPESQSFYCFGCGAGGDVITFIMKSENLDYPSAVEFLAKRAGVTLPEDATDAFFNKGVSRSRVIEMNTCAARYFRDMLFDEEVGAPARAYLAKRQLSLPIIKRFGLGYAPDSYHALHDHLRKNGFTDEEMTAGFFCGISRKTGKPYDYFRGRLMFPLIDVSGNIVAFGGRIIGEGDPKYLNTSDTPAFKKSKMLFALNYAKNTKEDFFILCEGNIDVISLHEAGFDNSVATLGTAITPEHARLLKKYTSRVVLAYDGDAAGKRATEKAVRILEDVGIDTKILEIKGAKDPDEYIKTYGKEAFRKILDASRPRMEWELDKILSKYNLDNPDDKVKASRDVAHAAAAIYSMVERDIFLTNAAKKLSIARKSLEYDVNSVISRNKKSEKSQRHETLIRQSSGSADRVNRDFVKFPKAARLEEMVLGMMLFCPELITSARDKLLLTEQDFATDYGKKLFGVMTSSESFDLSLLNEELTSDEVSRAMRLMNSRRQLKNTDEIFKETAVAMKAECRRATGERDSFEEIIKRRREESDKK